MTPTFTDTTVILKREALLANRFEVVRPLGEGAAGSIFHVKDMLRGNEVALKVLTNIDAFDENTLLRFKEELHVLRDLSHPNIVQAYELINVNNTIAFTMELIEGKDLGRVLRERVLSEGEITATISQLLEALEFLHNQNIFHRDIKLENILLAGGGHVKVTDLGLLKRANAQGPTKSGILLGTPQYMAPEYLRQGIYNVESELYAVGLVAYELLLRKRYLSYLDGAKVVPHLLKTKFLVPFEDMDTIAEPFKAFLQRALDVDPRRRFRNAQEMRNHLLPSEAATEQPHPSPLQKILRRLRLR